MESMGNDLGLYTFNAYVTCYNPAQTITNSNFVTGTLQTFMKTNSKHQGRKKQGHCIQGDYKHFGNQTHFTIRSILFRSILYKG